MSSPTKQRLEAAARTYLEQQLGARAPRELRFAALFDERPLPDEGETMLFEFDLQPAADACLPARHYVAVGVTEPNYFPAYGLSFDDAYSFHVGTRFMLETEIQLVDPENEPPGARGILRALLAEHAPGAQVGGESLAALFRCDDEYFAVYRVEVDRQPLYFLGADCPPGFYEMTEYPPQAALRLHLGKLLRREATAELNEGGQT